MFLHFYKKGGLAGLYPRSSEFRINKSYQIYEGKDEKCAGKKIHASEDTANLRFGEPDSSIIEGNNRSDEHKSPRNAF